MHIKILEEYERKTWADSLKRQRASVRVGASVGLANGSLFCSYAFLFWYGGQLIAANEISYENMMRALFCIMVRLRLAYYYYTNSNYDCN